MKNTFLILLLLCAVSVVKSQVSYSAKLETGFQKFLSRGMVVSAGPGWKGYDLEGANNGFDIGLVNGISFKEYFKIGLGVEYLKYDGINGYSIYGDLEATTTKSKTSPLFNLKIGKSHVNNQYEDGSDATFVEILGGIERKVIQKLALQLKIGFRFMHQFSVYFPIKVALRF